MSPNLLSRAGHLAGSSLLRLQSDDRLVALVRDGHDPAFTAVVDRYRAELLRYCTRLVGDDRAEDVVQQAFLNAHNALMSADNDIQLRPWLYRIAHNASLNTLRSQRQQVELDERLAMPGGLEQDVETRERLQEALTAIARLPEPQRDALTLRALEGRSHQEIAAALGVSPGAARQHLHRARTTVRAAVSAITPYGLMARFAMAGGDDHATGAILTAGTGASAGAGVTIAKVGAGVLAAGAIATGTTGHLPFTGKHTSPRPESAQAAPSEQRDDADSAAPGEALAVTEAVAETGGRSGASAHGRQLASRVRGRHGSRGSDSRSQGPGPAPSSSGSHRGDDDESGDDGEDVRREHSRSGDSEDERSGSSGGEDRSGSDSEDHASEPVEVHDAEDTPDAETTSTEAPSSGEDPSGSGDSTEDRSSDSLDSSGTGSVDDATVETPEADG